MFLFPCCFACWDFLGVFESLLLTFQGFLGVRRARKKPLVFLSFPASFPRVLGVRRVRRTLVFLSFFLGVFEKTKGKRSRATGQNPKQIPKNVSQLCSKGLESGRALKP